MRIGVKQVAALLVLAMVASGCAAAKAFRDGDRASLAGDLDQAVAEYRKAVQAAPENTSYKIALERAMQAASRAHLEHARDFEQKDQLEAAMGEYRQASDYDPSNRQAAAKVASLDRVIRDRVDAARPRPAIDQMRDRARAASAEPTLLNFTTPLPRIRYNNASLKDILNFMADATGINITYDREVADRPVTIQLDGLTLEQALNQIMAMNMYSYKVINERTIFVFPDTPPKHAQYDEQVVRTFYISHADATELTQTLSSVLRLPQMAVQPAIVANKTSNTITVRATSSVVQILEKIIQQNDKPRAEIVVDVEILEVDRSRSKTYGLNLSQYSIGGIFSPEVNPNGSVASTGTGTGTGTGTTTTATKSVAPEQAAASGSPLSPPAFNLNTISQGVTTADFYLAVPTAIVRFLESDTNTKLVAKPQLRGAEGTKLTLKLGDEIPIISTSYTPIATGGAGVNPLSSYQYKSVGVNIDMTPRVTLEGDILLDLTVESSSRGSDVVIAGINIPSFGQRTVTTRLRLRDGESNLLAGLLREDEQRAVTGFPGTLNIPLISQLFNSNTKTVAQTDIVMLLTPHIVRTQGITEDDLKPLYIGSAGNLNLGGPPPLIAPPAPAAPAATPAAPQPTPGPAEIPPPPGLTPVPGTVIVAPPGSSPVPGTVVVPQPTAPAPAPPPEPAPEAPAPPPQSSVSAPPPPPAADQGAAATTPAPDDVPITSPGIGSAQVIISPPGTDFRVGGGPYLVPLSITNATRLSTVTLTLIFDPTKLRVRTVQEGSFLRAGGVDVTFTQAINVNRIDITLSRGADELGVSGTGLLAAILFDAIAPGSAPLILSGSATGPGGTAMGLQFRPVTVTVQQ